MRVAVFRRGLKRQPPGRTMMGASRRPGAERCADGVLCRRGPKWMMYLGGAGVAQMFDGICAHMNFGEAVAKRSGIGRIGVGGTSESVEQPS